MSSDRWATPPAVWSGVLDLFGRNEFDLDAFSEHSDHVTVPSLHRFTVDDDALTSDWRGHHWAPGWTPSSTLVWAQPPFSRAALRRKGHKGKMAAVVRSVEMAKAGCVVCLYLPVTEPARSSKGSWVAILDLLSIHKVYFVGRVEHVPPTAQDKPSSPGASPHACWILAPWNVSPSPAWKAKTHWRVDQQRWMTPQDAIDLLDLTDI